MEKNPEQPKNPPEDISEAKESFESTQGSKENFEQNGITRRGFLKLLAFSAFTATTGYKLLGKVGEYFEDEKEEKVAEDNNEEIVEDLWYSIIDEITEKTQSIPTPQSVRAHLITKLFDIPQGWTSGLATQQVLAEGGSMRTERTAPELDKLVAEHLANRHVILGELENGPLTSRDYRDFVSAGENLEAFGEKVSHLTEGREMGERIYKVLKSEYEYGKKLQEQGIELEEKDEEIEFVYLPGGVPLILRGYTHTPEWQRERGEHLAETYRDMEYVGIEGFSNVAYGESLKKYWSEEDNQDGDYDLLMKELVKEGFDGSFFEIDGRDSSKVLLDCFHDENNHSHFQTLPDEFYATYFAYLEKENPVLARRIGSEISLKELLIKQSTSIEGEFNGTRTCDSETKSHSLKSSISDEFERVTLPTGNELGELVFTDALAVLKLHTLANAMQNGLIDTGMVVDFEGSGHLHFKSFFLKYPQYAVEVVLRSIHMLMAGEMGKKLTAEEQVGGKNRPENLEKVYEVFKNPDWTSIIQKIGEIAMWKPESDASKTVDIGFNQKELQEDTVLKNNVLAHLDEEMVWALYYDTFIQEQIDEAVARSKKR